MRQCTVYIGGANGFGVYNVNTGSEWKLYCDTQQERDQWLNVLEPFLKPSVRDCEVGIVLLLILVYLFYYFIFA